MVVVLGLHKVLETRWRDIYHSEHDSLILSAPGLVYDVLFLLLDEYEWLYLVASSSLALVFVFVFIALIWILCLRPPIRNIKLLVSITLWRGHVSENTKCTIHRTLPFSFTSYPPCVTHRTNSALLPTLVFLPRIEPSSFALYRA